MTDPANFIYVIDDEPVLAELAGAILGSEGYRTRTFTDPTEALEAFREEKERPFLIVTDCIMVGMTGLDLIDRCREIVPQIKSLLLSGTVDEEYLQNQPVKPDQFLRKPYRADSLLKMVNEASAVGMCAKA